MKHNEKAKFKAFPLGGPVLLFHAAAFAVFRMNPEAFSSLRSFVPQFYLFLGASFVSSLCLILFDNALLRFGLSALLFLVLLFVGMPMGEKAEIGLLLLVNLVVLTALLLPEHWNVVLPGAAIFGFLLTRDPGVAWGVAIRGMPPDRVVFVGIISFSFLFFSAFLKAEIRRRREQKLLIDQLYDTISKLTGSVIGFQQVAFLAEERSKVEECNRITHEIHDSIGYNLTTLMMLIEAALQLSKNNSSELQDLLKLAKDQAKQGLSDTRRSLRLLRSFEIQKIRGLKAVHKLISDFQTATGTTIDADYGNVPLLLKEEIDRDIYRIVQEGITNSFRHGKATQIKIYFWKKEGEIIITVQDNGAGCKEIEEGLGLAGMRERLETLGGGLSASSNQEGFKLTARVPYKES